MKRKSFIQSLGLLGLGLPLASFGLNDKPKSAIDFKGNTTRKMFLYGGNYHSQFNRYIQQLTGKAHPKVCFLGTASGDSDRYINGWVESTEGTGIQPYVQKAFINSRRQDETFEDVFMQMDAIVVGGGNTLNMLAIWQAQGIDNALKKAYEKGVIVAGGSAGSMCWFDHSITDSRPIRLTQMEGLGWLKGSHIPHYDTEGLRKPLFYDLLTMGKMPAGYACDEMAGIYLENEEVLKAVSCEEGASSYYVYLEGNKAQEKLLEMEHFY